MLPAVMAAASACTASAVLGSPGTPMVWAASILLFAPFGKVGRWLEETIDGRAARQNLWSMWPHFLACAVLCGAAAAVGHALAPVAEHLPLKLVKGLAWTYPALCSVAAAVAVRGSNARTAFRYAVGSAGYASASYGTPSDMSQGGHTWSFGLSGGVAVERQLIERLSLRIQT